jgi:DNA-binding transcriptional ArsR family regulator
VRMGSVVAPPSLSVKREAISSLLTLGAELHIVNHMVNYSASLDSTFGALADPTRRAILASLRRGHATMTELAKPHCMSLPAVMKHLRVLEHAGLLTQKKSGRTRHCQLAAEPLKNAEQWISQYRIFWEGTLDSLERYLSKQETKEDRSWPRRNRNQKTRSK